MSGIFALLSGVESVIVGALQQIAFLSGFLFAPLLDTRAILPNNCRYGNRHFHRQSVQLYRSADRAS
jgi:hypothetical protein